MGERLVIGADFSGHVDVGNLRDEEMMRYGVRMLKDKW